jgi:two-component system sensor histidine kinase RegB
VVFAAITLPQRYTWGIAALTIALYTLLFFWNVEVPYLQHHHLGEFFSLHVQGMWVSFVLLACIVAWFVVRMNATIRRQDALLAQSEKMTALGTLATNAVHELGTPLSTIALLAEDGAPDAAHRIAEQLARCKQILSGITQAGGVARAESAAPIAVRSFFIELTEQWQRDHPKVKLHTDTAKLGDHRILAEHGFAQAITNLLNNAADASPESVTMTVKSTSKRLVIEMRDCGDGIAAEIQSRLGRTGQSTKPEGMGLGLFLSHSVITRMGGSLRFTAAPVKGVIARVTLPLQGLLV